ncbi:MAG TPA: hypothetical protein VFI30_00420 [Nocardioidaceae bacterium]|nr:hypothetical protein [Nocardioidaceae bacterium]
MKFRIASRRRVCGVLVAGAVVSAVAGCGVGFHPGAAAVVDGTTITEGHVDNLVLAACEFTRLDRIAQGGNSPSTSVAALRSAIANSLIQFELDGRAASALGLTVHQAAMSQLASSINLPGGLDSSAAQLLRQYFTASARAQLQEAAIGAHLKNPKVTSADQATPAEEQASRGYLDNYARRQNVAVNPSYGKWNGTQIVRASGSLSDPVSSAALAWKQAAAADTPPPGTPASELCG